MPRKAAQPPESSDETPDPSGDTTQDERDAFAEAFDGLVKKVASIPDDLGEKLDRMLQAVEGTAAHEHPESSGQQGGTPQAGAPSGGAGQSATPVVEPEKKPQVRHWYYGPLRRS